MRAVFVAVALAAAAEARVDVGTERTWTHSLAVYVTHSLQTLRHANLLAQAGLDDGAWHSFEGTVTPTQVQLVVDGVEGPVATPSDERGNQTVKEFGRVETSVKHVIGQVP
jgi:hypothetical protein